MDEIAGADFSPPKAVLKALQLVKKGKIYSLGQTLEPGMPELADTPGISSGRRFNLITHGRPAAESGPLSDTIVIPTHTGTHIDALGHWYHHRTLFNGRRLDECWAEEGLLDLGIEKCLPIVARGVLLDVATHKEVEFLESHTAIAEEDLQVLVQDTSLEVRPGDVALIRTGWAKLWNSRDLRYIREEPGLDGSAALWLAGREVIAIGVDNWAVDFISPANPKNRVVHEICLAEKGIHLIENLNLEELAVDKIQEFLFIASPIRIRGASGSPIEPMAIV